jgi:hypothetical protein
MPEQRSSVSICLLELGWHLRMSSSDKSATGAGACHAIGHAGCLSRCFKCSIRNLSETRFAQQVVKFSKREALLPGEPLERCDSRQTTRRVE